MASVLPTWDLSDLYPALDAAAVEQDKQSLQQRVGEFAAQYRGNVSVLEASALAEAIRGYEQLQDGLGKLSSYADLLFATDTTTPAIVTLTQNLQEYVNAQSSMLVFFTLEINQIEDAALQRALDASAALAHYAPWLRDIRAFKPYQLDESLERLLLDKSITSDAAWVRLYEDTCNRMKITVGDEALTLTEALDLLSDTDAAKRKQAALALSHSFEAQLEQFTLIYNTLMKDKSIDDAWRGFDRPVSSRNLANLVEDSIVDTLAATITANFSNLSERYYTLKARLLGKERLDYWDRNAPLPGDADRFIPWEEARSIVLESYAHFSPRMASIAEEFFTKGWIDATVKPGKTSGAFSHPTVPSAHPYILLNYQGKVRDVMTLAHELGHGVHQVLSAAQGALMADTPLTLAETASVFGEQLTFQYLLSRETNHAERTHLIAGKSRFIILKRRCIRNVKPESFHRRSLPGTGWKRSAPVSAPPFIWMKATVPTGRIFPIFSIRRFMSMPMRSGIVW
jgi:oligoendopeptidase F